MNAIGFVKKHGIKEAIKVVGLHPVSTLINIDGSCVSVLDLKQIVEAFELVEAWGGIDKTKDRIDWAIVNKNFYAADMMKHAINLVEQCQ